MKTSRWRLNDENLGQINVDGVLLVSGQFEGTEGKRVVEFKCLRHQIRQVEVNEDPLDPLSDGAAKNVLDVFCMVEMISWLP
ncbi:hypothetical protein F2Q69_00015447 [Brassica cretica]|uniref:Uncharacterized protein n=1 Tax=Brassica cretica TaxID=69181 RepID=A0A8S9QR22_BRACR|nr:hypothetical protein F2Q69_00015447 [Brassica cretica]